MGLMDNKVVLITGGSRGIGEAIARKMATEGAHVAFTYRSSSERAEAIAAELTTLSGKAKAYQSDASSYEQSEALAKQVLEDFGQIDVLINNAGITRDNLMLRMSEDQWDDVINTKLKIDFKLV
ncbi:MAG: SDR family NAD(P)-dependent oxidoreductase, partial [Bacteroidota bacterium]